MVFIYMKLNFLRTKNLILLISLVIVYALIPLTSFATIKSHSITIAYGLENYNFDKVFKQFTQETGIEIQIAAFKNNELKAELLQRSNINQLPDIVIVPADFLGLKSINYSPIPESLLSKNISNEIKKSAKLGHKFFGIPIISGNHLVLYYNKALTPQPAKTWKMLAEETERYGKPIIAWSYHEMYWFMAFVGSFNATPLKHGKIDFQTPGMMQAMKWYKSLSNEKVVNTACTYTCASNAFVNGNLNYTINGAWAFQEFSDQLGNNLGVSSLPTYQGKKMASYFSSHVIAFPNNALDKKNAKSLITFARFFQQQKIQEYMWQDMKVLPSNAIVREKIKHGNTPSIKQILLQLDNAIAMPNDHAMAIVWEAMLKGMNRYLAGVLDEKKATKYMQYISEKSLNHDQN